MVSWEELQFIPSSVADDGPAYAVITVTSYRNYLLYVTALTTQPFFKDVT